MIAVTTSDAQVLRWLCLQGNRQRFGKHKTFGFVSQDVAEERARIRRKYYYHDAVDAWDFQFTIQLDEHGQFKPEACSGCVVQQISVGSWQLHAGHETFGLLARNDIASQQYVLPEREEKERNLTTVLFVLLALVGFSYLIVNAPTSENPTSLNDSLAQQKELHLPKVTVVEPKVEPPKVVPEQPKQVKAKQSPHQLGFLALLGKKNLSKAVGGMPTNAAVTSPGAGPGGDKGSGGELLSGLGAGVRKTTVGNSGVAGLGGLGKEGAGGGKGGEGTSYIGSGAGKGLADVAMTNDVILEGGLDRNVIAATIAKYISQVRACYERGLKQNPGLTGQVAMNFEINKEGALSFAKVSKSSLGNVTVEDCISNRMMGWRFPKPVGGVHVKVNYPFMLRPAG